MTSKLETVGCIRGRIRQHKQPQQYQQQQLLTNNNDSDTGSTAYVAPNIIASVNVALLTSPSIVQPLRSQPVKSPPARDKPARSEGKVGMLRAGAPWFACRYATKDTVAACATQHTRHRGTVLYPRLS